MWKCYIIVVEESRKKPVSVIHVQVLFWCFFTFFGNLLDQFSFVSSLLRYVLAPDASGFTFLRFVDQASSLRASPPGRGGAGKGRRACNYVSGI